MPIFMRDPESDELKAHHVGRVAKVFNADYRAMSDVYTWAMYATYLTEDLSEAKTIMVNANFECDQSRSYAVVDITPENQLIMQVVEYDRAQKLKAAEEAVNRKVIERCREAERNRPIFGKRMKVVKGRTVKPGTVGVVFWARDGRVGLDVTGRRDGQGRVVDPVFVSARYLEAA
jgi:hypothetical protein